MRLARGDRRGKSGVDFVARETGFTAKSLTTMLEAAPAPWQRELFGP